MFKTSIRTGLLTMTSLALLLTNPLLSSPAQADEFSKDELSRWQAQFDKVVQDGRKLWITPLGSNAVSCAQCHPNAANTHPETYPKFQKQLGKVAPIWEMVNWCLSNPVEGKALSADSAEMTALQAYITYERRGVKLDPGKH